jgi:hypothetical protein
MINVRTAVLAGLAVGGLAFAGCGGGDDSDTLSKAELAKKADAICVKYGPKQKALGSPTDAKSTIAYLDKLIPLSAEQRKDLDALKADDAVKDEWAALLKDYDEISNAAKQALTALKAGDEAEFQRIIEETNTVGEASDKKLDAFGAPHCGSKSDS